MPPTLRRPFGTGYPPVFSAFTRPVGPASLSTLALINRKPSRGLIRGISMGVSSLVGKEGVIRPFHPPCWAGIGGPKVSKCAILQWFYFSVLVDRAVCPLAASRQRTYWGKGPEQSLYARFAPLSFRWCFVFSVRFQVLVSSFSLTGRLPPLDRGPELSLYARFTPLSFRWCFALVVRLQVSVSSFNLTGRLAPR